MGREYYQLIKEANELVRLSLAVVQNADYKPCIKAATDPFLLDALKDLQRAKRTLEEIRNKQEHANVTSMPT